MDVTATPPSSILLSGSYLLVGLDQGISVYNLTSQLQQADSATVSNAVSLEESRIVDLSKIHSTKEASSPITGNLKYMKKAMNGIAIPPNNNN